MSRTSCNKQNELASPHARPHRTRHRGVVTLNPNCGKRHSRATLSRPHDLETSGDVVQYFVKRGVKGVIGPDAVTGDANTWSYPAGGQPRPNKIIHVRQSNPLNTGSAGLLGNGGSTTPAAATTHRPSAIFDIAQLLAAPVLLRRHQRWTLPRRHRLAPHEPVEAGCVKPRAQRDRSGADVFD